ncbi:aspartate aminotransferase [Anaeramoeba flamelloides]|uniref:Aspartate aminotransferase n=1 Tax=Anaeramoeba flamelloides TaxID=1746091 RepID=A0AAV7YSE9_9EUKA|nr:aspartate aminotransferase [Anaeramoeba flamelloides]
MNNLTNLQEPLKKISTPIIISELKKTNLINLAKKTRFDIKKPKFSLSLIQEHAQKISKTQNLGYTSIGGLNETLQKMKKDVFKTDLDSICSVGLLDEVTSFYATFSLLQKWYPESKVYIPGNSLPKYRNFFRFLPKNYENVNLYRRNEFYSNDHVVNTSSFRPGSIILMDIVDYNKKESQLTVEGWKRLAATFKENNLIAILNNSYSGFATGNFEEDQLPIHIFRSEKIPTIVIDDYSYRFGIPDAQVGVAHFLTPNQQSAINLKSDIEKLIRPLYSNQNRYYSLLASSVLGDNAELFQTQFKKSKQLLLKN